MGPVGMFGVAFGSDRSTRPLHRLTPLRDDPAVAWLSPAEKLRIDAVGWLLWAAFVVGMFVLRRLTRIAIFIFVTPIFSGRLATLVVGGLAAALAAPVRRSILRIKTERLEKLLRRQADDVAADDWAALAEMPDGNVISVVGWVRGQLYLPHPIGGESVVGVALPCQHTFPGVFESLHDFDLIDEEGQSILIRASEGRLFGTPNVSLDSNELRILFASLGVPSGATSSGWQVHTLRDGDPVMVVGTKQTALDPNEGSFRGPAARLALASSASPACPLLVFSIAAERRPA
jgi:hypothetical protein